MIFSIQQLLSYYVVIITMINYRSLFMSYYNIKQLKVQVQSTFFTVAQWIHIAFNVSKRTTNRCWCFWYINHVRTLAWGWTGSRSRSFRLHTISELEYYKKPLSSEHRRTPRTGTEELYNKSTGTWLASLCSKFCRSHPMPYHFQFRRSPSVSIPHCIGHITSISA